MRISSISLGELWSMAKESVSGWVDDFAPSMGAAIAYYTVFSIAPLLVIVIAVAGFFFGSEAASGHVYAQLAGLLGDQGAEAVQAMVASAGSTDEGVVATVIGLIVLAIGATTVFAELQSAHDRIWKAPAVKKVEGVWALLRARFLSLGLVVSIGFVMLVSLVLSAALAALGNWWSGAFENVEWLLHLLDFVVSLAVTTVMFALMYKILPRVKIAWHDVWVGSVATAILFAIGKFLVGLYVGKTSVASSFGTAGSLAVLLVWVYYSAQIFLLGAEFTWIYAHRVGSRQGKERPATAKDSIAAASPGADAEPRSVDVASLAPAALAIDRGRGDALLDAVGRHPAVLVGGALVLGTIVGSVLDNHRRRRYFETAR